MSRHILFSVFRRKLNYADKKRTIRT